MPYKSRAQQGYIHAAEERGDISKSVVDKFDKESKGQHDLPYHVKAKKESLAKKIAKTKNKQS